MAADDEFEVSIGAFRFDPLVGLPADVAGDQPQADEPGKPAARIIQFWRPPSRDELERFRAELGVDLSSYIGGEAFAERITPEVATRLADEAIVRTVAPYPDVVKVSPQFAVGFSQPDDAPAGRIVVRAMFFADVDPDAVEADLAAAGVDHLRVFDDRAQFTVGGRAELDAIARIAGIRSLEPVTRGVEDNSNAARAIQSGDASKGPFWDQGLHGEGQVISIFDRQVLDINHCFFADNTNNAVRGGHRKVVSLRAAGTAPLGHATFVAGCAAGDDVNNPGGHERRGGAWAAKLASIDRMQFMNAVPTSTLPAELAAASAAGARIHSNSWHDDPQGDGNPATYNQIALDIDTFTWNNEDHLVLGSAGNSGEEQGPPGTSKNAICVAAAATNLDDIGDGNPGPTADDRRKPDLAAVGCNIQSATVNTACGVGPRDACATSYATPHAAAAAALVRQYFMEGWYPQGVKSAASAITPTGALVKAILCNAAVDMSGEDDYPNDDEGWGVIRLDRVLTFAAIPFSTSTHSLRVWDVRHANGLSTGETATHSVFIFPGTGELKITLVWTDAPPAVAPFPIANPVMNNLDLEVTAPDGTLYLGNFFEDGQSATEGFPDSDNNVEMVLVKSPPDGQWTITVRATLVRLGNPNQGYALVAATHEGEVKRGCFVATAVYGDRRHPDVVAIRRWRDRHLARGDRRRGLMRALVTVYGVVGPPLARVVARHPRLRGALRRRVLGPFARRVDQGAP